MNLVRGDYIEFTLAQFEGGSFGSVGGRRYGGGGKYVGDKAFKGVIEKDDFSPTVAPLRARLAGAAPGVPKVVGGIDYRVREVKLPLLSYYPDLREHVVMDLIAKRKEDLLTAEKELSTARENLKKAIIRSKQNEEYPESKSKEGKGGEVGAEQTDENSVESSSVDPKVLRKLAQAKLRLAKKKAASRKAQLKDTNARIAAERLKYGLTDPSVILSEANASKRFLRLSSSASTSQCAFNLASAREKLAEAELHLKEVTLKPAGEPGKAKKTSEDATKKVDAAKKTLEEARKHAEKKTREYKTLGAIHETTSTGRRFALAKWITNRKNPLTARVAVNHVWNRHFGRPLVERLDDFGLRSPKPTHADLLDFLAVYFMENDWSL